MDERMESLTPEPPTVGEDSRSALDAGEAAEWLESGVDTRAEPPDSGDEVAVGDEIADRPDSGDEGGNGEYADVIRRLQALGATPELLREMLETCEQQVGPPGSPPMFPLEREGGFEEWVSRQGVDLDECSPADRLALQSAFRSEQALHALEQQAQLAQQQLLTAQWSSELQAVRETYAEFRDPDLARDLLARWLEAPDDVSISDVAEAMRGRWMRAYRNQLSSQAAEAGPPRLSAGRPVMRGGKQPPVSDVPDVTRMNDDEFERFIRSELETLGRAAR